MKNLILALMTVFGVIASAQAEMKPANTILDTYCGNLNRSVQICLSHNPTTGKAFIKIAVFNQKPEYLVVQRHVKPTRVGSMHQEFFASRVVIGRESQIGVVTDPRGYAIEQMVKLTIDGAVVAQPRITGILEVAGQASPARSFPMEMMFHTL